MDAHAKKMAIVVCDASWPRNQKFKRNLTGGEEVSSARTNWIPPKPHRDRPVLLYRSTSKAKLTTMPSAAALRAQQEKDAEFAPSNPFDGADEGLLLGTASDVVAEVAAKTNLFDAARDDIFPRFDDGGKT